MILSYRQSNYILKPSRTSGRLFQWMTALIIKNSFLMPRWNLSWCNLYPLPLVFPIWSLWKESLCSFSWPWAAWILWWFPSFTVRKDLTPSVFSHGAGSPALWPSSGGKAMEGSVQAGTTWWVLPGPSWGIPRLSACWKTLEQVENTLVLVGFCQIAATPDGGLLLLLLLTRYPSWGCCHHFQSGFLRLRCSPVLVTKLWPCPLGLAETCMPIPRSTGLIYRNC